MADNCQIQRCGETLCLCSGGWKLPRAPCYTSGWQNMWSCLRRRKKTKTIDGPNPMHWAMLVRDREKLILVRSKVLLGRGTNGHQQQWRSRTNLWTVILLIGVQWDRGRVGCWSILQRCIWWRSVAILEVVPSSSRLQFDKILDLPCFKSPTPFQGLVYFNQNPANSRQCRRYPLTRRDKLWFWDFWQLVPLAYGALHIKFLNNLLLFTCVPWIVWKNGHVSANNRVAIYGRCVGEQGRWSIMALELRNYQA